jgi:phosphoribosyl 1,2-cyclic phosphodiesterase/DNA-binding NarL/FixJ family response regulator
MFFSRKKTTPEVPPTAPARSVLLVDDDAEIRQLLRQWLEEDGWQVREAADGRAGLDQLRAQPTAVVIADLLMPRCHGFRLCRLIREDPAFKTIKVVISSGRGYPADRLNALSAGADEYLVKPVSQSDLRNLLHRLFSPEPAEPPVFDLPTKSMLGLPPAPEPEIPAELPGEQPVKIKFWGVRGSLPTPGPRTVYYGGNTTCVEVRADNEIIILDAGSGIRQLGLSLIQEFKDRPINATLLISHTHWDHIQGFPYFVPAYNPRNKLRICGFEGYKDGLQGILSSQMESPYFPVSLQEMPGNITFDELHDMEFHVGKVHVQAAFANHPGICVGYRLNTSAGSIAFFPDNEPHQRLRGQNTTILSRDAVNYARKQDERMIEFIRGVDVLIIDSHYDDAEYQRHVGWGHGCLDDVVTLALFAGVKQLYLFHHDPGHDDAQITRMVEWARDLVALHGDNLHVEAAREGLEIVLEPQPAHA